MMSPGNARQPLLGLGILLLTMIPGYVASRVTGASGSATDTSTSENVTDTSESTQSSPRIAFYIRTDFHIRVESDIRELAARYRLSEDLIAAVIEAESEFNPRAVSRTGARGLMQLMPETAAILGVGDPFDPRENIDAGVRHLRSLMDRFDGNLPLVLAAYNAGERAVIGHRGVPPYRETRQYVNRILRRLDRPNAKTSDAGRHERKA
jgi:soluble lytic murein transglycosylase-like protein